MEKLWKEAIPVGIVAFLVVGYWTDSLWKGVLGGVIVSIIYCAIRPISKH